MNRMHYPASLRPAHNLSRPRKARFQPQVECLEDRALLTCEAVTLPLHTEGRWIIDAAGCPFTFHSANWYGAEELDYVPAGLERQDVSSIARQIRAMGFNSVRLPWSNEMVELNPVVNDPRVLMANPGLLGRTALEIFDVVVGALVAEGLLIVLDNHTSDAAWCCSDTDGNGLWYNARYPESSWLADWQGLAARYLGQPAVVAADLRNEPRCDGPRCATWGGPPDTDWKAAAERGGNAVLAVNPNLLIIVEGIGYAGHLRGAATNPVVLDVPGRLVYSAHDYPWFHSVYTSMADIFWDLDRRWGFLVEEGQPYTAPVYVGEFGTCYTSVTCYRSLTAGSYGLWYQAMLQYLAEHRLDWAYWAVNGTQARAPGRIFGAPETYGLFNVAWNGPAQPDHLAALQSALGVPAPWAERDIGSVGYRGSAGLAGASFAIRGSGADIGDYADAFHFAYQPLTGDGHIVTRVLSVQNTEALAKAGIMVRAGLSPFARHASLFVTPGNSVRFVRRLSDGEGTTTSSVAGIAPYWLVLLRVGDTLTGFISPNGKNWSQLGPTEYVPLPETVYVGLAVSSRTNGALNVSTFDTVVVMPLRGSNPRGELPGGQSPQSAGRPQPASWLVADGTAAQIVAELVADDQRRSSTCSAWSAAGRWSASSSARYRGSRNGGRNDAGRRSMSKHVGRKRRWTQTDARRHLSPLGEVVYHKGAWYALFAYRTFAPSEHAHAPPSWEAHSGRLGPFKRPRDAMVALEREVSFLRNWHGENFLIGDQL